MQTSSVSAIALSPGTYWSWRNQSIYCVRAGQSHVQRPPLLLIHGFGASTFHWRKNIADLSQDFEVWAIDLLGFGRSAKPKLPYSGDLWRDQLSDFITEVIQQPVILAGNSLGGYAALCVAAQRPAHARGLVLLNSAGPFTEAQAAAKPDPIRAFFGNAVQTIFRQPWGSFLLFQYMRQRSVVRDTLKRVYLNHEAITEDLIDDILQAAADEGAIDVFASIFSSPQGEKIDTLLEQLTCPLLMLWGKGDPWMNAESRGARFRQHYPTLTEHYLHAGHCPHDEVPEQVNALIREWALSL